MLSSDNLRLYEEVLLLAMKDEEGTIAGGTMYNYAVGGAVVAEMLLENRIEVEESRRKLVSIVDSGQMGDTLLDEWLLKMASVKRRKSLQGWVEKIASTKDMKNRIAMQLCGKGILRMDEGTVLFLFKRNIYPEINPEPERRVIGRLYNAIFSETNDIDARTVVLLSLAKSANILPVIFDKRDLKQRKKRIDQVVNGDLCGKATKEAIDAMHAAIMVCCIMPAIAST